MHRYLDCNATCPPLEEALAAFLKAAREYPGNPSSLHWAGRAARRELEDAREKLAAFVHAEPGSVVFTSGGTEADNIAIQGALAEAHPGQIVTTAIEHPAVLQPLERWQSASAREAGWQVVLVRPDASGVVPAAEMISRITAETRLVCMMLANNETGAIQPVAEVAAYCRKLGVPMLVDAVQALGKMSVDFTALAADFMALSAHKIGGPKGVGVLLVRRGVKLRELAPGGGQERKRRSGTENVPGIAGFAAALGVIDFAGLAAVRDHFERRLLEDLPEATIFSATAERLPNTSMLSLPGMDGETLLMQLDLAGFAVASGSACSSGKREPSHVLLAMGCSQEVARSSIRISFGPGSAIGDAEALVAELLRIRQRLQAMAGITA
ncbi:MAG TPA: cysteine desulfurase family protein [Mariprofundaceae bacterium]|nr:cysteine desulfurase family protein [Mariprofundaceae bacterium]